MAKAHIEVSNAAELVSAVTQMHSLEIRQAQENFYKGIQVYGARFPVYSMWMRIFFAQSVLCLVGFIVMMGFAFALVDEAPNDALTASVSACAFIFVGLAVFIAGLVMMNKRHRIPRPKRR